MYRNSIDHTALCPPYCGQTKPGYQIIQLPKVESPVPPQLINGTPGPQLQTPSTPLSIPSVDGAIEWVKANPLIAAAVGVGLYMMLGKK